MEGDTEGLRTRDENRWRIVLWCTALLLLMLPLIAMQFTDEVSWDTVDFVVFGAMLAAACGSYEFAVRLSGNKAYRAAAGIALATAFLLIWINLAVGIIGNADNPANLLYGGVVFIGIVGACIARGRPRAMARALEVTAIAQVIVAVIAWLAEKGDTFVLTGLFVALWLTSGWLFRQAARESLQSRA